MALSLVWGTLIINSLFFHAVPSLSDEHREFPMFDDTHAVLVRNHLRNPWESLWAQPLGGDKNSKGGCQLGPGRRNFGAKPIVPGERA